jgi:hypothetical protein
MEVGKSFAVDFRLSVFQRVRAVLQSTTGYTVSCDKLVNWVSVSVNQYGTLTTDVAGTTTFARRRGVMPEYIPLYNIVYVSSPNTTNG